MMGDQTETTETTPLRRWGLAPQRVTELAVVVFGVLIALGLENTVQEFRWRAEARELEQLFRADLRDNLSRALERRAVDPCLSERLSALAAEADNPAGTYRPQVFPGLVDERAASKLPTAYRAPLALWRTASFERALGSEAAKRLPQERLIQYGTAFATVAVVREAQNEEANAIAALQPLAMGHRDLTAEVRADVLRDVAVADGARGKMLLGTLRLIERIEALGIEPDVAWLRERLDQQRRVHGACVDAEGAMKRSASGSGA